MTGWKNIILANTLIENGVTRLMMPGGKSEQSAEKLIKLWSNQHKIMERLAVNIFSGTHEPRLISLVLIMNHRKQKIQFYF